jgi:zinc transporter ZupT
VNLVRVWAMLTGLVLTVWYFAALYLGDAPSPLLPMLVTGIGGFEMYQFALDVWTRRRRSRG